MKKLKRILALTSALSLIFTLTACKNKKKSDTVGGLSSVLQESSIPENPLENKTLYWLSDYNLNPQENENRSAPLALFENTYGSKIEYIHVEADEKYTRLAQMIQAGEQVDMFPFDMSALPQHSLNNLFQPLDDYYDILEMEDEMWSDMKPLIEELKYKDSHYVIPYALSSPNLLTYSKTVIQSLELEDPYELYTQGKWTWDKFIELMKAFVQKSPVKYGKYGITGELGKGILQSVGEPVVINENGTFSNNMNSPMIEKAENFIAEIRSANLYLDSKATYFPKKKNVLFFAGSDWSLAETNAKYPDEEYMIVPFPKPDEASSHSSGFDISAIMLAANSQHGEAVAAYINCERIARTTEEYLAIVKEKSIAENITATGVLAGVIKENQYDALQTYLNPTVLKPVIDLGYGMGNAMYDTDTYNYETRGIMNNLNDGLLNYKNTAKDWATMKEKLSRTADVEIEKYN